MKYRVSDEDQRRRDQMWDERQKSVCAYCGEAIADYAGTWLHVIGGEKYCEITRPVATPPAKEPKQ